MIVLNTPGYQCAMVNRGYCGIKRKAKQVLASLWIFEYYTEAQVEAVTYLALYGLINAKQIG